jgi:hypothetical protein
MITVHYRDAGPIVVGERARVWPIDHPGPYVSNKGWVETSPVQGVDLFSNARGPIFWTQSGTRYVPGNTDESLPKASPRKARA